MKKVRLSLILISAILIFVGGMFLTSCDKTELVAPNEKEGLEKSVEAEQEVKMPKVKKGILVFDNRQSANEYLNNFVSNTKVYQKYEEGIGFKSVQTLYWEILDTQSDLYDKYDAIYEANKNDLSKIENQSFEKYTDITKKYLASGFISEEEIDVDGEKIERLELTTSAPYYAPILNMENLVVINDTIYQFNAGEMRMITDGDFSKIEQMQKASDTNLDEDIIVATEKSKSTTYSDVIEYASDIDWDKWL